MYVRLAVLLCLIPTLVLADPVKTDSPKPTDKELQAEVAQSQSYIIGLQGALSAATKQRNDALDEVVRLNGVIAQLVKK